MSKLHKCHDAYVPLYVHIHICGWDSPCHESFVGEDHNDEANPWFGKRPSGSDPSTPSSKHSHRNPSFLDLIPYWDRLFSSQPCLITKGYQRVHTIGCLKLLVSEILVCRYSQLFANTEIPLPCLSSNSWCILKLLICSNSDSNAQVWPQRAAPCTEMDWTTNISMTYKQQ